jgi:hypothetical protein
MKYSILYIIAIFQLLNHVSSSLRPYKNDYNIPDYEKRNKKIISTYHKNLIYDEDAPPAPSPAPTPSPAPSPTPSPVDDKNMTIINKELNIDIIADELNMTGYLNLYFVNKLFRIPIHNDVQIHYNLSDIYTDMYNAIIHSLFNNITQIVTREKNNNIHTIHNLQNNTIDKLDKTRNFSFRRLLFLKEEEL